MLLTSMSELWLMPFTCFASDMYCRHDPLLENAIFIKHGNVIGSVMEIICDEGYRVSNLNTNTVNSTCVADSTATYVGWFWVPPCEGKLMTK